MEKLKILLVDDEPAFTRMVKLNLEETGHYVVRVENQSPKAAVAARQFKPDLIFLDIVMPEKDGGDVAAEIKSDPKLKSTPIVYLTAMVSSSESTKEPFTSAGELFLSKPVTVEKLNRCIKKVLNL
ncbi:MAG: response regulator [Opitutales bacterium]|nr:response regulator [Opitutales bacterium]